jgi:hypothetical protein
MSALSIQPTYPIFTDIDGQPLEAGYVWIGTANLDPQTNPINVYWDAALTILAPQPIRTLAGYPSNNGTPARLYVNSDYSIRVMNKNGSTVYSAPAATERLSAALISYQPAGIGAVPTTVQAKLQQTVSVKDFGAVGDGVADDTAAVQLAFNAGGGVYFPPGVYLLASQIALPNYTFYDDEPGHTVYGQNAQIIVETTVPLFTNDQVAAPTGYTSKWKFKDLSFFSSTANSKLFDMDRIYNSIFSHCVFEGIASVFYSRIDRTGNPLYPEGYMQSAYINNNHFAACAKVVDAKRAYNVAISNNFFEGCGNCVVVDGLSDAACNEIRITDNVMEGGGVAIILGGVFGGVIQGNYFEANSAAPTCDVNLAVSGASAHRGLAIIGNQFQPTTTQRADTNWFCVRLANTISAGRGPTILSNVTSGPRLVTGADRHSLVMGNFESGGSTQILDSFPMVTQTNVEIGGINAGFVNNRATAYDSGTSTWKIININNIVRNAVYEVDGFLNLLNIGANLLGRTRVSLKFWVQIDAQSVYTAGIIGTPEIEDLAGARDLSGNPMYTSYWGAVTPSFSFSGSTLTISFDTFNDYSTPSLGDAFTLGPDLAVRAIKGNPNFTRVQISMP